MVVIAAAITTKNGKTLLSRQFMDVTRVKIEGLLAAFPKLITTETQHTFIETDSIRYVYLPLETLYMLIITTKNSNITEDLETLHLLTKMVPDYCRSIDEDHVGKNAFELIFAMDELIQMGHKEKAYIASN